LGGALGESNSGSMCGLDLSRPLPLPRLQAWLEAFKALNAPTLERMDKEVRLAVLNVRERNRGPNGKHMLATPFRQWFLTRGELCITAAIDKDGKGHWREPLHQDGGASVLHMGITLYGRRRITHKQGQALPDIVLDNQPGSVYLGLLTGPWHQVSHQPAAAGELLSLAKLGDCSVTVMVRTALFPHCRSRTRNTTPSPKVLFRDLAAVLRAAVASGPWTLPSLAMCEEALVKIPEPLHAAMMPAKEDDEAAIPTGSSLTQARSRKRLLGRKPSKGAAKRRRVK
jgi:hypothetical protein